MRRLQPAWLLLLNQIAVNVPVTPGRYQDHVDQPPNSQATARQQLQDPEANLAGVKAIDS